MHFGVELHAEIFALHIAHRRKGTVAAARQGNEALREFRDPISVRHPYFGNHFQHSARNGRLDLGWAIFALRRWINLSTQRVVDVNWLTLVIIFDWFYVILGNGLGSRDN